MRMTGWLEEPLLPGPHVTRAGADKKFSLRENNSPGIFKPTGHFRFKRKNHDSITFYHHPTIISLKTQACYWIALPANSLDWQAGNYPTGDEGLL